MRQKEKVFIESHGLEEEHWLDHGWTLGSHIGWLLHHVRSLV